jgi:hypothetical protein
MVERQSGLIGKSGVYALIINNIIRYIGSTGYSLESRKSNHLSNLREGKHLIKELQALFDEFGEQNYSFKVIEYCQKSKTLEREQYWKEIYKDTIVNKNDVLNTYKYLRRGKKAVNHKDVFREAMKGLDNPNCQTDINTIITIKRMIVDGYRNCDIAKVVGKTGSYISEIRRGKRWADVNIENDYTFTEEDFECEGISLRDN